MKIDSRFISTPTRVFALLVIYGTGFALGRRGVVLNIWDTDVDDDLPRSVCNGMDSRLWGDLGTEEVQAATNVAYLEVGPEAHNPRELFKPLFLGLLWLIKRSRVGDVAVILVQLFRDEVQVPLSESLTPFVHELYLRGIQVFRVRH